MTTSLTSYPSTYDVWRIKYISLNRDISSVCLFFFFFLYAAFKKNHCTRTQSTKPIFIITLIFKIFASPVNFFREEITSRSVHDVSKFGTNVCMLNTNYLWTGQGSIQFASTEYNTTEIVYVIWSPVRLRWCMMVCSGEVLLSAVLYSMAVLATVFQV